MKKYICILLCALCFSGCELDIPSQMSLDANQELNNDDVNKLLNGLYESIVNPSGYGYFNIIYPDVLADDLKPVKFQWYQVQYAYEHKIPADDILNGYLYPYFYAGISRANTILKAPSANDAQKGIAKYCRAICYLRLIDLYGPVPIIDEEYDNSHIQRSSEKKVLEFIVQDLVFAKSNAPAFDGVNTNPSSEAAQALLARVYRIQGNISQAGVEAEALITGGKFSLSNNPKGDMEKEIIMNFATLPGLSSSNAEWGWIMSWDARAWNCFAMADEVIALIKDGDRRKVFYDIDEAPDRLNYVFPNKYKQANADAELMISRLAEMYLISAEAGNTNRLTQFQTYRNSSLSLEDERRLELAGEFLRWRELKMKGETYVIPIPKSSVDANPLLKEGVLE